MAKQQTRFQNSFVSGEWDPKLDDRSDLAGYENACRTLQNWMLYAQGGAFKRPGFQYIATVPDSDDFVRLLPFEFSDTDAYALEFSDLLIRFYRTTSSGSGLVLDDNGTDITSIVSPYTSGASASASQLPALQHAQTGDVLYITHPSHKPRRLVRTDVNKWTISAPDFVRGPFLKENDTSTTIKIKAYEIDAVSTGTGGTFTIKNDGDLSAIIRVSDKILVVGSTANDGTWTVTNIDYTSPPDFVVTVAEGEDITDGTADGKIWPDLSASGQVQLIASGQTFESTHVGALWELIYARDAEEVTASKTDATATDYVTVALGQKVDFFTTGTWTASVDLEVSYDESVTWEKVYPPSFANDGNIDIKEENDVDDARYRVNVTSYTSGTIKINLIARRAKVQGVVEISSFTDSTNAEATIKVQPGRAGAPTKLWSEGAWSDKRGWPVAVAFFEQRLFFGGTTYQPTNIWGSKSLPGGDFHNFTAGVLDDDAITFTLAESQNPIKWLSSDKQLIIGTAGGEYTLGASSPTEPLTPTNVNHSTPQGTQGSAGIMPLQTSAGHLYVERGGRKVNELVFSFERDRFVSADMTRLAGHITEGGINETSLQKRPEPILWGITGDGVLVGMMYLREEGIVAWFRVVPGASGLVESKTIIPGIGTEDELWTVIKVTINSADVRYVCKMNDWATVDGSGNPEDAILVDYALTYGPSDGPATDTITNLGHLEGETVSVLADGAIHANEVVSGAQITLDKIATDAHVGSAYTATLKPMKIPTHELKKLIIKKVVGNFYNTGYVEVGSSASDLEVFIGHASAGDDMDAPVELVTGTRKITFPGGFDLGGDIIFQSDKPLPVTILSLTLLTEVN